MTGMCRANMSAVTVVACMHCLAMTVTFMCGVAVTHTELSPTTALKQCIKIGQPPS